LRGTFAHQGGNAGLGLNATVDSFEGVQKNDNGKKNVLGLGGGVGIGGGINAYGGATYTVVTPITRLW
jgi:hypothetical protein